MKKQRNYLDFVPMINNELEWNIDEGGIVVITVINKGFFNKIAQKFFKAPKKSKIKLDEYGSRVWQCIDDNKAIWKIAEEIREYSEDIENVFYERLVKFFHILKENKFIKYKQ